MAGPPPHRGTGQCLSSQSKAEGPEVAFSGLSHILNVVLTSSFGIKDFIIVSLIASLTDTLLNFQLSVGLSGFLIVIDIQFKFFLFCENFKAC